MHYASGIMYRENLSLSVFFQFWLVGSTPPHPPQTGILHQWAVLCEHLVHVQGVQSCYLFVEWLGVEPSTLRLAMIRSNTR